MDEFTKTQNAQLVRLLDMLEHQIRDDIVATLLQLGDQRYIDLAGMVHDTGDESVADVLTELDNKHVDRSLQKLHEIEVASKRLAEGTINCCIECQNQFEKTRAHKATPRL